MHLVSSNLKYLRKQKGWTQEGFANEIGVKRSLIGAYEEGRADPRISTLLKMANVFGLSLDDLISTDLQTESPGKVKTTTKTKVIAITVDQEDNENIELVPQKASAGYMEGYADPDYVKDLPKFHLPNLPKNRTYRAFEISGDSMLPILPGTIIIGQYVETLESIKNGKTYIVVTEQEGVVYKRVFNYLEDKGALYMVSDNKVYAPYEVAAEHVLEVWEAKAFISTQFPETAPAAQNPGMSMQELTSMVLDLKEEVTKLKG